MNLSFLGPFHPQIVHTPIVLLIFSAFLALVGRLMRRTSDRYLELEAQGLKARSEASARRDAASA